MIPLIVDMFPLATAPLATADDFDVNDEGVCHLAPLQPEYIFLAVVQTASQRFIFASQSLISILSVELSTP